MCFLSDINMRCSLYVSKYIKLRYQFKKNIAYPSSVTLYSVYSAYIRELSTDRPTYQQNRHCFDRTL